MITTSEEYLANLLRIQEQDKSKLALLLPKDENIYKINLNSRQIEAPEFVGITEDHDAEIIYFEMDRYYEGLDMATTCGVIRYVNAEGEARIFPIPYFDIETHSYVDEDGYVQNKILFPWIIDKEVTKKKGVIYFSMSFFIIDPVGQYYLFNLNLLTAKTTVLPGIETSFIIKEKFPVVEDFEGFNAYGNFLADSYNDLLYRISRLEDTNKIYWTINE